MADMKEGRLVIDEAGHEIFYRLFGQGPETLVCCHGGPGANHQYLLPLGRIAGDGLQVLLYDQLGSGQSDRPDDDSLWNIPRFVEELETIRTKMGLGRIHLLGQSWGGMLALQYALDHPQGVKSLIPSNIGSCTAEFVRGMHRCREELPIDVFRKIVKYEGNQDYENPEFKEAVWEFYAHFVRRCTPFERERSLKECKELLEPLFADIGRAYEVMNGPTEFTIIGPMIDWDVTDRLHEIKAPTLILTGWYDEVVPEVHRTMADRIPDNEFIIFGNSSHCITLEKEAEAYLGVVRNFIDRVIARG